jgi:hypothetical protein
MCVIADVWMICACVHGCMDGCSGYVFANVWMIYACVHACTDGCSA